MEHKQHPRALKRLGHTCQFCGKKHLSKTRSRNYRPYAFHHTDGDAYDNERTGWNLVLLCKGCHRLAHGLGGQWLSQGAVRRQNKSELWGQFPNIGQRAFNAVCRTPGSFWQQALVLGIATWAIAATV